MIGILIKYDHAARNIDAWSHISEGIPNKKAETFRLSYFFRNSQLCAPRTRIVLYLEL